MVLLLLHPLISIVVISANNAFFIAASLSLLGASQYRAECTFISLIVFWYMSMCYAPLRHFKSYL
ncbi:hypothetical protein HALA3H3_200034 [Halomonas sp. A3H3]|nr:hypothetical protein HALA3H3_200034 [Halomonas sp. A3H3]